MVIAWVLTLPGAALIGAGAHEGVAAFSSDTAGVLVVGAVTIAIAIAIFIQANRSDAVTAGNVLDEDDRDLAPLHAGAVMGAPA
jgi:hypothetical protein